jgi:hypothetical protein
VDAEISITSSGSIVTIPLAASYVRTRSSRERDVATA